MLREARDLPRPRATLERRLAERDLVRYLKDMGNLPAVEKVLREALSQRQTAWPPGHPEITAAQVNLAAFLIEQKQYAKAEPLLLAAYQSLQTHSQANSHSLKRRRRETVDRIVQLYNTWGKTDQADLWRKKRETLGSALLRPEPD